jgi:hypothetical protein
VVELLASLGSLLGSTRGEDLLLSVFETMKKHGLPWSELNRVTVDEAVGMTGKRTDMMGRTRHEIDLKQKFYVKINCSIHQQSLCEKTKFEHVMKVMASVVNFIQSHELGHCQFQFVCVRALAELWLCF